MPIGPKQIKITYDKELVTAACGAIDSYLSDSAWLVRNRRAGNACTGLDGKDVNGYFWDIFPLSMPTETEKNNPSVLSKPDIDEIIRLYKEAGWLEVKLMQDADKDKTHYLRFVTDEILF